MKLHNPVFFEIPGSWALTLLVALSCIGLTTTNSNAATTEAPEIACGRMGSIALGTADTYFAFLEMKRRNMVKEDFEPWAMEHNGEKSLVAMKDHLNDLYAQKVQSPAIFGVHVFYKCMDAAHANVKWINEDVIPMCFLNLEIANSISSGKRIGVKKEDEISHLRSFGYTKLIDNVIGLSKVNEMIEATYNAKNISEEVDFQESMLQRCMDASKKLIRK